MKYLVIALVILLLVNVCATQLCTGEGLQGCSSIALSTGKILCALWDEITYCLESLKCPEQRINELTKTFEENNGLNCTAVQTCTKENLEQCSLQLLASQKTGCKFKKEITDCWEGLECPERFLNVVKKGFEEAIAPHCNAELTCTEEKIAQCSEKFVFSQITDCDTLEEITNCWRDLKCSEAVIKASTETFNEKTGLNCTVRKTCTVENTNECTQKVYFSQKKNCDFWYATATCFESLKCSKAFIKISTGAFNEEAGLNCLAEQTCTEKKIEQCSYKLLLSQKKDCEAWNSELKCLEALNCTKKLVDSALKHFEEKTGLQCQACTPERIEECGYEASASHKRGCDLWTEWRKCMEVLYCRTDIIDENTKPFYEATGLKCGSTSNFPFASLVIILLFSVWNK